LYRAYFTLLFFLVLTPPPPIPTLFPYTTLFRSRRHVQPRCTRAGPNNTTTVDGSAGHLVPARVGRRAWEGSHCTRMHDRRPTRRSEEHTSELQSRGHLVCRLLLEKKKKNNTTRN